jgi:superfamily II DNA helicase RecQ
MQIKFFTIPIFGGEAAAEAMNSFLRSRKILHTEGQLLSNAGAVCWCFCIRYMGDEPVAGRERAKIDYMEVLDADSFQRFSKMRIIRKQLAAEEAIPAYAVFTDAELAELACIEKLSIETMKQVKGIGEKKTAKYGLHFINSPQ